MPPTPASSRYRTACPADLTCPPVSSRKTPPGCSREQISDGPASSLHPDYRGFTATTGWSAGQRRLGTQRLTVSAARRAPSRSSAPQRGTEDSIGTGLPKFRAEAADRSRAASMPDTTWPTSGHPPGSSRDYLKAPVSMSATHFDTSSAVRSRSPSRSPPDTSRAPFPQRSPRRSSANAA